MNIEEKALLFLALVDILLYIEGDVNKEGKDRVSEVREVLQDLLKSYYDDLS